jgi:hypothetical protein
MVPVRHIESKTALLDCGRQRSEVRQWSRSQGRAAPHFRGRPLAGHFAEMALPVRLDLRCVAAICLEL